MVEADAEAEVDAGAQLWSDDAKVESLIERVVEDRALVDELREELPPALQDTLASAEFVGMCMDKFDALDTDLSGVLEADELSPLMVEMLGEGGGEASLTLDQCTRFSSLFDRDGDGTIDRGEFYHLVVFVVVLNYLESLREAEAEMAEAADLARGEAVEEVFKDTQRVTSMLENLARNTRLVDDMLLRLPRDLQAVIGSPQFTELVEQRFDALDTDRSNTLDADELYEVMCDLTGDLSYSVTRDHCDKFVHIFNTSGSGADGTAETLDRVDFERFCRFMVVAAHLEGMASGAGSPLREAGSAAGGVGAEAAAPPVAAATSPTSAGPESPESQRLTRLIQRLEGDRSYVETVLPDLPDHVRDYLVSDEFADLAAAKFRDVDSDGNGYLTADELYPLVVELFESQPYDVTLDHCRRFAKVFDDDGNGVITTDEFLQFCTFTLVMCYLGAPIGAGAADAAVDLDFGEGEPETELGKVTKLEETRLGINLLVAHD